VHELFIELIRRQGVAGDPEGAARPRAAGEPGRTVAAPVNC
jgi:hypothetical protein